jgi:DNA-binding transcriptional LysR family regulator
MDIDYFREFVVLADTGNYLAAADKLYLTQSTLTRHIQTFEKELGVQVFDRTTRKITLNDYGQLMLPYAREIMQLQDNYYTAVYNRQRLEHNNIQIGSIPTMVSYGITDVLVEFKKEHPSISIDIQESDSSQLISLLEKGRCDFVFMRESGQTPIDVEKIQFSRDSMVAIMSSNNPLARNSTISIAQLKGIPLILLAKDAMMYSLCISECRKAGFDPTVSFTSHHASNILDMAKKEMGVALLMEKPILKYDLHDLSIIDITPSIETSIDLIYQKGKKPTKASELFLNYMKEKANVDI